MHIETTKKLKQIYDRFSESTKPIHRAYLESIHALVKFAEMRDPCTKGHSFNVARYSVLLSENMGLAKSYIEIIKLAAILHDVGKIGIKENVLVKNGPLTKKEYAEVKKHPGFGVRIIKPLRFFNDVIPMMKHHHENYDGTGYPDGLKGEDIPLGARILAIADVYDALVTTRSYRKAFSEKGVLEMMKKEGGQKFDPELLKIFIDSISPKARERRGSGSNKNRQ